MTGKIIAYCACGSAEEAERIARVLVEKRLAACVNIVPGMRSIYHWKGAIEDSSEWLLLIKSTAALFDSLRAEIEALHSYEVPEVIAVPVAAGAKKYLNWMDLELGSKD